jgi:hypothetical protein
MYAGPQFLPFRLSSRSIHPPRNIRAPRFPGYGPGELDVRPIIMYKLFLLIFLSINCIGCLSNGGTIYKCSFVPVPQMQIKLVHNHPFLAEYKKIVEINKKTFDIGIDPGGQAEVHVYEDELNFIIVTQKCDWITINKVTFEVQVVEKTYETVVPKKYYGKCGFDKNHKLIFNMAKEGEFENPHILKGG